MYEKPHNSDTSSLNQTAPTSIGPPAGWYQDPQKGQTRWWDGRAWTEHRAPASSHIGAPNLQNIDAKRSNPIANTGFALGICSFFLFGIPYLGILITLSAVVFSTVGLAKQTPAHVRSGQVLGLIGLCLGILYTLMCFVFLATGRY